jgi:hypothetical protein
LPPSVSVHRDDWKLIRLFHAGENGAHRYQLFNLAEDLGEKHNRAAAQPALVKELDALIEAFLTETQAVLPLPNPNFDPAQHRPELEGKQQPKAKAAPKGKPGAKGPAKVGRWQHSPHATPKRVDQQLHIQSSGGDPWIATLADLKAEAEPLRVQLTFSSQAGGSAAVYFTRNADEPFHKDRSISFTPLHDGEWHEYQVALPTRQIHSLRLDPATQAGLIRITHFQVQTADGKVLLDLLAP